jgi:ribosomal protein S12 methylthiotransferase accessory factor
MAEAFYRLAPGLEIVSLGSDNFQLRSDFVALKLSGETAVELVKKVLQSLERPMDFEAISSRMPDYRPESLRAQLDKLVQEGALVRGPPSLTCNNPTFGMFLDEAGFGASDTLARLARCRVAIFGLEAHGSHVAQMLADAGVGCLVLADPFPFEPAHHALTPVRDPNALGLSRELATANQVKRAGLEIVMAGQEPLDRARVRSMATGAHLLIACWDRGFNAAHHWVNEAALKLGVPALFSELHATSSFAGPLLLPGRSACWMCYRMRAMAAEQDFNLAMAYEEHLDRTRRPRLSERPMLPALPAHLAATLALESLRLLLRLNHPTLADKVLVFDSLLSETRFHPVLVKPFCPACSKKKARYQPASEGLFDMRGQTARPLVELADVLVSDRTGIVVEFAAAARDATEPALPLVWRAKLSNHCFVSNRDEWHTSCSGKGMTRAEAWTSCLGEAAERYSAGCWDSEEVVLCRRCELDGRSLDPVELVLYRPEQYSGLPYTPYSEESKLRWVRGRSLICQDEVWIPAIAVFMEYQVDDQEEFLCPVTSNGLAAGPTLGDAVLAALYEVLERDAMLITWSNRLPARRYDAAAHPDSEVRRLVNAYRRRGVEVALFGLPTDHPVAVLLGIAFQSGGYGGPYATVGLGADIDPVAAARAALLEVGQVRPAFREQCRSHSARIAELVLAPSQTRTLEDHALLYADPSMAQAFYFLEGTRAEWPCSRELICQSALEVVLDHFRSVGQDVLYVNLTPRDLEAFGVFTARVMVPGFQPLWFGHQECRLGGRRLFEMPFHLGLRLTPADVSSLNPLPHPIA